jgi:hypothetical protein
VALLGERQRSEGSEVVAHATVTAAAVGSSASAKQPSRASSVRFSPKYWSYNKMGHMQRNCMVNVQASGNGQKTEGEAQVGHP